MGQNKTTRTPQVLVFGSSYQGKPSLVRILDPQPFFRILKKGALLFQDGFHTGKYGDPKTAVAYSDKCSFVQIST